MKPNYSIEVTSAPAAEPVTPAELGSWLGVTVDAGNTALLTALLLSARNACERFLGVALVTQTIKQMYDLQQSPNGTDWFDGVRELPVSEVICAPRYFDLARYPVASVTSVKFYDEADTPTTAEVASYYTNTKNRVPQVALRHGFTWPSDTYRIRDAVEIIYVAGFGDASAVPQLLKDGIRALAAYTYDHRGECDNIDYIIKSGAAVMWDSYRVKQT